MNGLETSYEMFWAGYLAALAESGAVTAETPPEEIWQMKAEFMAGIRGERMPCDTKVQVHS